MTDEQAHGDVVGMGMAENEIARLEQAMAEKDQELQQIREHEFQNGYREAEAIWKEKYQQLMEKAVRFASTVEDCNWVEDTDEWAAREFLKTPEAQAFLKEREEQP